MQVNEDRLNSFMGKMLGDVGAAMNASLMLLGDKLGLYRALARNGPMDPATLAGIPARPSDTSGNGFRRRPPPAMSNMTARRANSRCCPNRSWRSPTRIARYSWGPSAAWSLRPSWTSRKSPRRSRPAKVWAGTSAASVCFAERRVSSAPPTSIIWCRNGCPRLTGSSTGSREGPRWRMSAAVTAYRPA